MIFGGSIYIYIPELSYFVSKVCDEKVSSLSEITYPKNKKKQKQNQKQNKQTNKQKRN